LWLADDKKYSCAYIHIMSNASKAKNCWGGLSPPQQFLALLLILMLDYPIEKIQARLVKIKKIFLYKKFV
jgi:hypothetical protein